MRIVTNPGSNLSQAMLSHYDVVRAPQQIVVDGRSFDTRESISLSQVDEWVKAAKVHPYVIGTTAAEFATLFVELGRDDPDIIAIMTSRKIISSYDAACSAARTLAKHPRHEQLRVRVVDTRVTDIGAGLVCLLAGEAVRAGLDADGIEELAVAAAQRSHILMYVHELDNMVKGGRAGFLRAMVANLLGIRPVIAMRDGEVASLATIKRKLDPSEELVRLLGHEVQPGAKLWVGVIHGGRPDGAHAVLERLRRQYDVQWAHVSAPATSIYLHTGPGAIGMFVLQLDGLPWQPPPPPVVD